MIDRPHVAISGDLCAGKTTLARNLAASTRRLVVSARDVIRSLSPIPLETRSAFQEFGAELEATTQGRWLADEVTKMMTSQRQAVLVIDSVRTPRQLAALRTACSEPSLIHVHLSAATTELERRYSSRADAIDPQGVAFAEARRHEVESFEAELAALAEVCIETTALLPLDVATQVARLLPS